MNEPKLSFPNELTENGNKPEWSGGIYSRLKKEPQMNWDKNPVDITGFLKKEPPASTVEGEPVDWKEYAVPEMNEKEKLLNELLLEKDKTIAAKDEIIDLQRKLIEQLLKDR
ncbi:hypothetical protein [Methylotuvimicrobium sp. KM2]|uniref:hypothetical protein n=1 Tax=Methylotuvimicrobium sp. KM2 TaxID=3133976 RepID=UPI003100BB05